MNRRKALSVVSLALLLSLLLTMSLAEGQRRYKSSRIGPNRGADVVAGVYNVRAFGARGDGKALDTPAINKAIEIPAAAGGGTVRFPAGDYLSVSIHLQEQYFALPRSRRHDYRCRTVERRQI